MVCRFAGNFVPTSVAPPSAGRAPEQRLGGVGRTPRHGAAPRRRIRASTGPPGAVRGAGGRAGRRRRVQHQPVQLTATSCATTASSPGSRCRRAIRRLRAPPGPVRVADRRAIAADHENVALLPSRRGKRRRTGRAEIGHSPAPRIGPASPAPAPGWARTARRPVSLAIPAAAAAVARGSRFSCGCCSTRMKSRMSTTAGGRFCDARGLIRMQ